MGRNENGTAAGSQPPACRRVSADRRSARLCGAVHICNLYTDLRAQTAISQLARSLRDKTGNLKRMTGIFPDYPAPIVRTGEDGGRELVLVRWGMRSPAFALEGKTIDKGVTNVCNTKSPHGRRWLGPTSRCLATFTAFAEPNRLPDGTSENVWFAIGEDRPLAFFAGVRTNWTSARKTSEGEDNADLFAILTTDPNAEVGAAHQKPDLFRAAEAALQLCIACRRVCEPYVLCLRRIAWFSAPTLR
jgi:putative SOS response-associated peptidase YedK